MIFLLKSFVGLMIALLICSCQYVFLLLLVLADFCEKNEFLQARIMKILLIHIGRRNSIVLFEHLSEIKRVLVPDSKRKFLHAGKISAVDD